MTIENLIQEKVVEAIETLYGSKVPEKMVQLQTTRKEFEGDITLVVFPFLRMSKKKPEETATEIGNYLKEKVEQIDDFNIIKGFLNLSINNSYWIEVLNKAFQNPTYGHKEILPNSPNTVIEYSSPNTNKPLHLGHIRNNLLGYSVACILKANGKNVQKVNLVNDRGIHICKSMLAWQKWGNGETPESANMKGDHLVGKYYVRFDQEYKKEIKELIEKGISEADAKKQAPSLLEAQEMLRKWEAEDTEIRELWETMNNWVYAGFDVTYKRLGVDFDKIYHESETYKLGKSCILKGLEDGVLIQKEDSSIWADLTKDKLDEKILLRSDGTSVYMTQDIGTANLRYQDYSFDKHVYVVGNEQDYHFKVLKLVLKKLGFDWAETLEHLSYGMVELPHGKMKSREGTVVDADELVDEMIATARRMSEELGKLEGYSEKEAEKVYRMIALGALKYFMLKVDPKKKMLFNPEESIDFNGNTGPFIQYTHARICSIFRKAEEKDFAIPNELNTNLELNKKEIDLIKFINRYPTVIEEAGNSFSPALVANYTYDLVKEYNQFYHDFPVMKEENEEKRSFRLYLSKVVARTIKSSMELLGIEVPERM